LHHSAGEGTPEAIHGYHLSLGWAGIAYHYYVRRDGKIYRGRPEDMTGGHTTNWNWCSVGICFEGNFETESMSEAQRKAGAALVADIASRHPGIIPGRHSQFGATSCPGRLFPYEELVSKLNPEPDADPETTDKPDAWAEYECRSAVDNGLFMGDGSGLFRWREPVSRQELAVILSRFERMF
jgi:N-acetyl-anhydromuramyl-L-alanine amidase AmpD